MRTLLLLFILPFLIHPQETSAQAAGNYEDMEQRFTKARLSPQDSAAFRKQGEHKVRQLFENGSFYAANQNVSANQVYVTQQTQPLFQAAQADTINYNALLQQISQAQCKGRVQLQTDAAPKLLGTTRTLNCTPEVVIDLVLTRNSKKFGKTSEQVWEVLLANPQVR